MEPSDPTLQTHFVHITPHFLRAYGLQMDYGFTNPKVLEMTFIVS